MKTYFTLQFNQSNAIDNPKFKGYAELQPVDICRLISAHARYAYSLQFVKRTPNVEYQSLDCILNQLDVMVLHEVITLEHYTFGIVDTMQDVKLKVGHEDRYYIIDLSDPVLEFKELSKDRTAMLAENIRVGELMQFLFKNNIQFEYYGSRAKLKVPMGWVGDMRCAICGGYRCGYDYTIMIYKKQSRLAKETVTIDPIN